jgi:hypothetical protein
VVSNTQITCQPAAHANGIYDVAVTVNGVVSLGWPQLVNNDYDYIDPMTITGISPFTGGEDGGDTVTITGAGFLSTHVAGASTPPTITFDPGGTPADCDLISYTDTEIVCTTSAHAHGLVAVKVDNGLQNYTMAANQAADGGPVMNGDKSQSVGGFLYYELYVGLDLSQGSVSFSVLPSDANGNSNFDIVTARTNLSTGYQLGMKTDANTLVCSGLDVCSSHWYSSIAASGSLSDDSWGRQLDYLANPADASQTDPAKPPPTAWQPIPISDTVMFNKSGLDIGVTDVGGDKFRLWYGAKASWFMPVTTYKRQVTITAIANI